MTPTFFETPSPWRAWLERYHASQPELWVGYYKKGSGRPSLTWPESVDAALCFGWIDGVRKGIDDQRYAIRFTPRRPGSIWSAVNLRRAGELVELGLMRPAGLAAFEARSEKKSKVYSYEQKREPAFDRAQAARFAADEAAWAFFRAQPPSYRRVATWWVVSAKREETRLRRLEALIEDSALGRRMERFARPTRSP